MGTPLAIAYGAYERSGFPSAIPLNVLSEKAPTKGGVDALIGRACVQAFLQVGTAPIRGVFAKAGLLGGRAFIVANDTAYLVSVGGAITALTGTIAGDGLVEIDGGFDQDGASLIRIATGSALYAFVDSGTVVVDEGRVASSVAFLGGYWLYSEGGTDYNYYQPPASSSWSPIEFAAAEYRPDPLKGIRVIGDQAALIGSDSIEWWYLTGTAADPMAPSGGQKYDIGCRNIASAVNCRGTLIWVADDNTVRASEGGEPREISGPDISEQLRQTADADLSATYYEQDGHRVYVLHFGTDRTWSFDLTMTRWHAFGSLGYDYWRPRLMANVSGLAVLAADRNSNQVWTLSADGGTDDGEAVPKEFHAFHNAPRGTPIGNLVLYANLGDAPSSAPADESIVVMQMSFDGGKSWSSPRERGLGVLGDRRNAPRWNGLGMVRGDLGVIFKFACSGAGKFAVYGAEINV
jgi:hypothetical protein